MPTSLTFDEHIAALEASGPRLVAYVVDAGMDAAVPTCPDWSARQLLAHQAMVHRWATAQVRGDDPASVPDQDELAKSAADLPGYYVEGHGALVAALRAAPEDLEAMTFLKDAPPPRRFWARRQAHETTMHMVDALSATLGRPPGVGEAGIDSSLAADGVDELLRGFFTRGRSKLFEDEEYTVAVEANDVDRRWVLHVGERLTVEPDGQEGEVRDVAARIAGPAADLYVALWNRGGEVEVSGRPEILDRWRATQRVTWT